MGESIGSHVSPEPVAVGDSHAAEGRRGTAWRGWVLSVLVAILLSLTATLLLGGYEAFRSDRAPAGAGGRGSGAGSSCCPPADAGK